MSPIPDDLSALKDDMVAFIEGHGMKRFHGFVDHEEVQSITWKGENPESWKDFVELAKAAESPFVTMDSWSLKREELDEMIELLVYEASTEWYDHYQRLNELSEDFGGIPIDEPDQDDEP